MPTPESNILTGKGLKPDARYGSFLVAKFINYVMWGGKKSEAAYAVYAAMETAAQKVGKDPLEVLETAIGNVRPMIEVRSKRVGGATYQIPREVPRHRALALALRWIRDAARKKKGRRMEVKLSQELLDAYNNTGEAFNTRENLHKMAEANKAFAHFA